MIFIITGGFILLDLITGIVKALKEKEFNSTKMREGLYHKSGSILCMLFGAGVDYAQNFLDLGFTVPVSTAICVYIIAMEIGSIIENICALNPEIAPEAITQLFQKLKGGK